MAAKNTHLLDSGYTQSGVRWEVHKYNLRYATLYAVRVNGQETQFRKRSECYNHLSSTNVQRFHKKILDSGKEAYMPLSPHGEADGNDSGGPSNSGGNEPDNPPRA